MYLLPFIQFTKLFFISTTLFAAHIRSVADKKKRPTTWLIDGNNFLGQKGTPRDGDVLADRLKPIATTAAEQVILVFDGRKGETDRSDVMDGPLFRKIHLKEGEIADDFIIQEIQSIAAVSKSNRVKLVTADKKLRSIALETRPTVKSVVNPKVCNMSGMMTLNGMM